MRGSSSAKSQNKWNKQKDENQSVFVLLFIYKVPLPCYIEERSNETS